MAISVSFLNIANTDIDAESPITSALMTAYRDRDQFLYEWIGRDYTPAENHNHNGNNSARISGQIVRSYFGSTASGTLTGNGFTNVLIVPGVTVQSGDICFIWVTYHGDVAWAGDSVGGQPALNFNFAVLHNNIQIFQIPHNFGNNYVDTKRYAAQLAYNVRYNQVRSGALVLRAHVPDNFFFGQYTNATMNVLVFRNP